MIQGQKGDMLTLLCYLVYKSKKSFVKKRIF